MNDPIKLAIERLYQVFKIYKIEDLAKVSCFDFGPTEEELAGLSKGLRNIPINVLDKMEFYAEGWNSWGSENEVKYFLPRLLECIAENVEFLSYPSCFSLFKYKLPNCFSAINKDWSDVEKNSIKDFFDALLEFHFFKSVEIGYLIECALTLNMLPDLIVSKWNSNEKLHKKQVINLFKHFNCPDYARPCNPEGVYLGNSERIKTFLDYVYTRLTAEELAEISFL